MNHPAVRDAALLLFRVVIGLVFISHGVDKVFMTGMDATVESFTSMGIPAPQLLAWLTAIGELLGGAMVVIGLLTTLCAALLALIPAGALYFVHMGNGIFAAEGGIEFVVVLIAALLMIIVFGAGRASLDGVLSRVEP